MQQIMSINQELVSPISTANLISTNAYIFSDQHL